MRIVWLLICKLNSKHITYTRCIIYLRIQFTYYTEISWYTRIFVDWMGQDSLYNIWSSKYGFIHIIIIIEPNKQHRCCAASAHPTCSVGHICHVWSHLKILWYYRMDPCTNTNTHTRTRTQGILCAHPWADTHQRHDIRAGTTDLSALLGAPKRKMLRS